MDHTDPALLVECLKLAYHAVFQQELICTIDAESHDEPIVYAEALGVSFTLGRITVLRDAPVTLATMYQPPYQTLQRTQGWIIAVVSPIPATRDAPEDVDLVELGREEHIQNAVSLALTKLIAERIDTTIDDWAEAKFYDEE
jgi:hypothetical protein